MPHNCPVTGDGVAKSDSCFQSIPICQTGSQGQLWIGTEKRACVDRLSTTLPTLHDLTEHSADFTPRFASCDARVVLRSKLVALPRRDPLFKMQLADFLPCIRCLNGYFLCSIFGWDVSVIFAAIHVFLLLNGCSLYLRLLRVVESVIWACSDVLTTLLWLWVEVDALPRLRIIDEVPQG